MGNWLNSIRVLTIAICMFIALFTASTSATLVDDSLTLDLDQPGPIDLGIVNDERMIEALMERGEISITLSAAGKEKALKEYLEKRANGQTHKHSEEASLGEDHHQRIKKIQEKMKTGMAYSSNTQVLDNKLPGLKLPSVFQDRWQGEVRTDLVLVIAIDFPDLPTGNLTREETDMYYDDYPIVHYERMIFGDEGYSGPNGENLISMKQYYERQSGGSYSINGEVAGWYTAAHPASYYGSNVPDPDGNDAKPRTLVAEALMHAAQDPDINLRDYDLEDRYDLDGDGDFREPDGLVDHLMIIHSGAGEEAGGGSLGENAIWSHRWNLGGVFVIPGTYAKVPYWGGGIGVFDYTIEPEDGATGVFAHEYGHDLGLPDEYDTQYTGEGEPVAYWSIMSSGSWAGKIPGTEPTGFSAWSKEFLQGYVGGNWLTGTSIDTTDPSFRGKLVVLDQANDKGIWNDAVRIELPDKIVHVNQPYSGNYEYHSGKGNSLDHSMVTSLDLTSAKSAKLTFKAWYEIEENWDYASVQIKESNGTEWITVKGNMTTDDNPNDQNPGHGITGHSDGWVDGVFDLTDFVGNKLDLKLNYWTDVAAAEKGIYVDDLTITVDEEMVLFDDVEGDPKFKLEGFIRDTGSFKSKHYYLLEWRNHQGVDIGLKHILRGDSLMEYDPGLVVWYVDYSYTDNWTGLHPGEGFLGVVDAHQSTLQWSDGSIASTKYQINDAAFGITKTNEEHLDYHESLGISLSSPMLRGDWLFTDQDDYLNPGLLDAGRNIPNYGLNIVVLSQAKDQSTALVGIFKVK
jgi:immune inhibitor A